MKHINKYKKKERKKERNKTENAHKILHERRERTLRIRVGLNDWWYKKKTEMLLLEILEDCIVFLE